MRMRTSMVIGLGCAGVLAAAAFYPKPKEIAPRAGATADCAPNPAAPSPPRRAEDGAPKRQVGACAAAKSAAEQTEDAVYIMRRNGPPEAQMLL